MRPFVAVLRRELNEHRLLLAGAGLISLFPVLLPFLPGVGKSPSDIADARGGAALILAALLSALLAVALGATVLARDLSERRLGFYFARPIPGLAIFAGKTVAALAVTLTAAAVVLLPPLLLGDLANIGRFLGIPAVPLAVLWSGLVLVVLLAAHTLSSIVRSRSAWLLLDFAAAVLVTGLLMAGYGRLNQAGAYGLSYLLALVFLAFAMLALGAAALVQILRGRTELHQGHRWLSSVLWGLLITGLAALAGYSVWALRAEPKDLRNLFLARSAPDGDWVYLIGTAAGRPGYEPGFLLESSSGRFVRLGSLRLSRLLDTLDFSADGRWAAWLEGGSAPALAWVDLKAPELRPVRRALPEAPAEIALSPDGRHLAIRLRSRLLVEEKATGRLIASVPLPSSEARLHFPDSSRLFLLRANVQEGAETVIEELDLASGKLSRVLATPGRLWRGTLSPDGRRLLMSNDEGRGFRLFDVATGAELARLQPPPNVSDFGQLAFLSNGRIAVGRWSYTSTELRIYDRDGAHVLQTFRWPGYKDFQLGGELSGDRLVVILSKERFNRSQQFRTVVLDLGTGESRPLGQGLVPLWTYSDEPGRLEPSLFLRQRKELFRLDPETGEPRRILSLS
ncbi:MAG TPA: hypothetical protein VHN15_09370 [Thermoanaerobaculia bacterium]|nr:hypothetical protein [Thermoanaerobaculia bacterium]